MTLEAYTKESQSKVHGLIHNLYKDVYYEASQEVKKLRSQFKDYSVRVTGHSIGASVSLLVGMSLIKDGIKETSCVSFGAPRIGDSAFSIFSNKVMPK